jgi:hypothetical protein
MTTVSTLLDGPAGSNLNNLGIEITSAANLGATTVIRGHAPRSGGGNSGIRRYYQVNPANNTNLNATLVMHYDDSELEIGVDEEDLVLYKSSDGVSWFHMPSVVNAAANTITVTGIEKFSYWTISDSLNSPLPVELISFSATLSGDVVALTWTTATEINNAGFTIERSQDTKTFESIGYTPGAGNSNMLISYNFIDSEPLPSISYYRLRQTDYDGAFKFSKLVSVINKGASYVHQVFVPSDGSLSFVTSSQEGNLSIEIMDISGKIVYSTNFYNETSSVHTMNIPQMSKGIYLLRVYSHSGNEYQTLKFLVN